MLRGTGRVHPKKGSSFCPSSRGDLDSEIASSLPEEGTVKGIPFSPDAGGVRASTSHGSLSRNDDLAFNPFSTAPLLVVSNRLE